MKEKKAKINDDMKNEEMNAEEVKQEQQNKVADDSSVEVEIEKPETDESEVLNKIEKLEADNKDLHDRLLRRIAEFENYKRRTENEQMNFVRYAAEHFIVDMLPIYDDLERSLNHINDENKNSLIQGLKMVHDKFGKVLENHGVKRIDAVGKEFDINYHEALMRQETNEYPPDTVINVYDNGYIYKDKVIKHAKVIVSAEPAVQNNSGEENSTNNEK